MAKKSPYKKSVVTSVTVCGELNMEDGVINVEGELVNLDSLLQDFDNCLIEFSVKKEDTQLDIPYETDEIE